MTKGEFIDAMEEMGWTFLSEYFGGMMEFEKYSPAGEDMIITVDSSCVGKCLENFYQDYDPDQHVLECLKAKENGDETVPGVCELAEDAIWLEQEFCKLAEHFYSIDYLHAITKDELVRKMAEFGWSLHTANEEILCFRTTSLAGEMLSLVVERNNVCGSFEAICDHFDPEQHILDQLEKKHRELNSDIPDVITLANDAQWIENEYRKYLEYFSDVRSV